MSNKPLVNKEKMPQYPLDNRTAMEGDTDEAVGNPEPAWAGAGSLVCQTPIIMSQTEGYLPSLSEFHYCRENGFGIGGNDRNYFVELVPDITLSTLPQFALS